MSEHRKPEDCATHDPGLMKKQMANALAKTHISPKSINAIIEIYVRISLDCSIFHMLPF